MSCRETSDLLSAYVDGELDSAESAAVERHTHRCDLCLIEIENLRALAATIENSALRFEPSEHLKRNLQTTIQVANPLARESFLGWDWGIALASAVLLVALTWTFGTQWRKSSDERLLITEIVSSHVHSMMANHITDVSSSDSHTVKPWFSGRINYSPPTKDLTDQGFRLIGGRLDYVDNRPVAALVYRRSPHFINLFVWPSADSIHKEAEFTRQGYNLIHWTDSGMTYWLVSELSLAELKECARLLRQ
jgi:anti-sigma factor RsiW